MLHIWPSNCHPKLGFSLELTSAFPVIIPLSKSLWLWTQWLSVWLFDEMCAYALTERVTHGPEVTFLGQKNWNSNTQLPSGKLWIQKCLTVDFWLESNSMDSYISQLHTCGLIYLFVYSVMLLGSSGYKHLTLLKCNLPRLFIYSLSWTATNWAQKPKARVFSMS